MPSQFFGLNIAYTGLTASNAALNTTANNISNAETEGYSRQKVNQVSADALRTFTTYGCAGAGVEVLSIERIRDEFYDNKYWATTTNAGEYDMKSYYMRQIEDYFADDQTTEGFSTIFNKMMDAMAEVKKMGGTISTKAQFMGFADNLAEYFNNMANNMELVQKDVNSELKVKVDEINSIASEIATLNKQINVIEMSGARANELRDARTLLLDKLSAVVEIDVTEIPITDSNDPTRETGGNRFIIKIAGGQTLVDTNEYKTLACIARTSKEKVNQSDVDGLYDVYWVSDMRTGALGEQFNLYNTQLGGELQGLVEMRDGNNGEYFNGIVEEMGVSTKTDENGNLIKGEAGNDLKTVTISVTSSYLEDLNKGTLSNSGGKINIGNTLYYYTDWTYVKNENGDVSYTFTIDESINDAKLESSKVGKEATIGENIRYQGVPYYQEQMNEWVRVFAKACNDIMESGYDAYGGHGNILFSGNFETGNQTTKDNNGNLMDSYQMLFNYEYDTDIDGDGTVTVNKDDDTYYRLTAKNFDVYAPLFADPDLLATKTDPTAGADEYGNITKFIDMTSDKNTASFRGASVDEFLTSILSDVALNAKSANTFHTTYENVGKSINNQRISISGVDNDEEAVNLVKYQNAYTLASKMIQTLTEVYDRLILETGV